MRHRQVLDASRSRALMPAGKDYYPFPIRPGKGPIAFPVHSRGRLDARSRQLSPSAGGQVRLIVSGKKRAGFQRIAYPPQAGKDRPALNRPGI